jgi:acetyl/propionyl-CoA carboxylase alpha subunit
MITGLDLIQEQVRAAQGEVLRWKQEDITIKVRGHSQSDTLPEEIPPG